MIACLTFLLVDAIKRQIPRNRVILWVVGGGLLYYCIFPLYLLLRQRTRKLIAIPVSTVLAVLVGFTLFLPYFEKTAPPRPGSSRAEAKVAKGGVTAVKDSKDPSVKAVKSGTLAIDKSVTVGNALDGYGYFANREWSTIKDSQNRKIVQFRGCLDYDKFVGAELQGTTLTEDMVKKAKAVFSQGKVELTFIVQFAISTVGDTFEVKYSGVEVKGINKDTGVSETNIQPDENSVILQHVYANKPEPATFALLLSSSLNPSNGSGGGRGPEASEANKGSATEGKKPGAAAVEPVRTDIMFNPLGITFRETPESVEQKLGASGLQGGGMVWRGMTIDVPEWVVKTTSGPDGKDFSAALKEPFSEAFFFFGTDTGELLTITIAAANGDDKRGEEDPLYAKLVSKYGRPTNLTPERAEWFGKSEELHYDRIKRVQYYVNIRAFEELKEKAQAAERQKQDEKKNNLEKF
jgi:hypothetical protein